MCRSGKRSSGSRVRSPSLRSVLINKNPRRTRRKTKTGDVQPQATRTRLTRNPRARNDDSRYHIPFSTCLNF
jgi:hypothetical protein